MVYSFSGSKYYSEGIKELLNSGLRRELWNMLDSYVQVEVVQDKLVRVLFIKDNRLNGMQQVQMLVGDDLIIGSVSLDEILISEIWIIDEQEFVIMLLPGER